MNLNGWEYDDIHKESRDLNLSGLIKLYEREDQKYTQKCRELIKNLKNFTEEGKTAFEKECDLLEGHKMILAIKIADALIK